MPYKSSKQRRFFQMCKHNPSKAKGKCPKQSVLEEYNREDRKTKRRKSHK